MKNSFIRKLLLVCFLTTVINYSFSQDTLKDNSKDNSNKKHLNELGIDMTPFIKFYVNFSDHYNYYYAPTYMLTYRRYLCNSNLRSALGGNYSLSSAPSAYNGDSLNINYQVKFSTINFKLGYEFYQNLSKQWQVFYGADFSTFFTNNKNDVQFFNGGYATGVNNITKGFGLIPVLGIRFKMNNRLSLITESSIVFQYSENHSQRTYSPIHGAYPPKSNDPKVVKKTFSTSFSSPLSLLLTFTL